MKYLKIFEKFNKITTYQSKSGRTRHIDTINNEPTSNKSLATSILLKNKLKKEEFTDLMHKISSYFSDSYIDFLIDNPSKLESNLISLNNLMFLMEKEKEGTLKCEYCNKPLVLNNWLKYTKRPVNDNTATCDHKTPISKGGDKFNFNNLAVSCSKCNNKKAEKSYNDWIEYKKNKK